MSRLLVTGAGGFLALAESELEGAVNLCSGQGVQVAELVRGLARLAGAEDRVDLGALPARPGDPPRIVGATRRRAALGWSPRVDLEEGLARTLAWWREHGP